MKTRKISAPVSELTVYGNMYQQSHFEELKHFFNVMSHEGLNLIFERNFGQYLIANNVIAPSAPLTLLPPEGADAIISIGGDGTFLHAALWVGEREIPVLGINTGHLGFLAPYTLAEGTRLAAAFKRGVLEIEHRSMLEMSGDSIPEDYWRYALNEVALMKSETSSMINVSVDIDGFFLADYLADGLLISTPTGSTAYNLSAGGPIIQPTLGCLSVTPIAPHTLTLRPIVVSGDSELKLKVQSRSPEFRVSADGRSFVCPVGSELTIRKAPFATLMLHLPGDDFAAIMRNKLLWGAR